MRCCIGCACCCPLPLQVEDAAVANSIRMLEIHASSGSMGSDLSDASSATQYGRSPSPLAMMG